MRPHSITMQAFGPYADRQELNFDDLQGRTFFLIHGPTGAGKTSILDAMCFGLYGESSGIRDGKSLRSDYADANLQTEVIFVFAVGNERYRVQRSPEQERTKKSGSGTTRSKGEAALWRLGEAEQEELIVAGYEKVTDRIKILLGFEGAQFRQVVLLPQGDFRRLLLASSGERQVIMQALFKTDMYQKIEKKLTEKHSALEERLVQVKALQQSIVAMAQVDDVSQLEVRLQERKNSLVQVADKVAQAEKQVAKANAAVTAGELAQALLDEEQHALVAVKELVGKLPVVEIKKHELNRAKQAASLTDVELSCKQAQIDVEGVVSAIEKQERQVLLAVTKADLANQNLQKEQDRNDERMQAEREVLRLKELEGKADVWQQAQVEAMAASNLEEKLRTEKEQITSKLKIVREKCTLKMSEREQALHLAAQVERWQGETERLKQLTAKRIALDETGKVYKLSEEQVALAQDQLTKSEQQCLQAKVAMEEGQAAWASGQAALMATHLQAGQACPVCGSLEHPTPAQGGRDLPDEQVLKERQQSVDQWEKKRMLAANEAVECRAKVAALAQRMEELHQELGKVAQATVQECRQQEQAARVEYEKAQAAVAQAEVLSAMLSELNAEECQGVEKLEQATTAWQSAVSTCKALEAVLHERSQGIPLELRDLGALQAAQQKAIKRVEDLQESLKRAEQAARLASEESTALTAVLETVRQNRLKAEARWREEQVRFGNRLAEAGFDHFDEYVTAKKSQEYMKTLEERILNFDNQLMAARERVERATQAAKDIPQPNVTELRETVNTLQLQFKASLAERESRVGEIHNDEKWLEQLQQVASDMAEINRVYPVLAQLHRVANGQNPQKITFQRYVLGALLDDVAQAANARFRIMSRGRYHLRRTIEQEDKRKLGGLDLEVFDSYTGEARSVSTLSGGETFLASLSLALGLADVVQAYSGGIRIDTILVDEGFGSLDPETLDFALQALLDLQQGGRLVGIISHLPEVKQRIDARLEVRPSDRGSRAKFVVG